MSTGMKQKVSIARTIVHDPPVIIFDEPTSGLDVLVARAVLKAVAALRDQGKCIIFVAGKLPADIEHQLNKNFGSLKLNQKSLPLVQYLGYIPIGILL